MTLRICAPGSRRDEPAPARTRARWRRRDDRRRPGPGCAGGTAMIGSSLGPYRIIEQLGAGGMGEVYLAEDTRLGRKVAV